MFIGDPTSVSARTLYRMRRLFAQVSQLVAPEPSTPPPITMEVQALAPEVEIDKPEQFDDNPYGSGAYGRWILDESKLPAYDYKMNQFEDARAHYPVSEGVFRRDHWHQVGNERLTALASNDGTVQVYIADRGGIFLNFFNHGQMMSRLGAAWEIVSILVLAIPRVVTSFLLPAREPGVGERVRKVLKAPGAHQADDRRHAYCGGFAYLKVGDEVWATAYRYAPALRKQMARVFGMGYYKTVVEHRHIRTERCVYAPAGDVSALLVDVELTNTGSEPVTLEYYEYWDVNFQQLQFQALRSGAFGIAGDGERRKINHKFTPCLVWIPEAKAFRFHHQPPASAPGVDVPDEINWHPHDVFLADLSGGETPQRYSDKVKFFGNGGAERPDGVGQAGETSVSPVNGIIMPYCMVLRRDVTVEAGKSVSLRFAYGTVPPEAEFDCSPNAPPAKMPANWEKSFRDKYRLDKKKNKPFADMVDYWKRSLAYFSIGQHSHIQREMAWHAYYLQSSTIYNESFKRHVVPQGSAYLYLHGLDGAARDFALYALSLTYLNPCLARNLLCVIMQMTYRENGQIAYAYTGNGVLSSALVHHFPSDMDLFLLLALTEYIAATGDVDFLEEKVDFYPKTPQPPKHTVLDHARVAFDHLLNDDTIGIGESDLIRVKDGDWSDDVVLKNTVPLRWWPLRSSTKTFKEGESVLNTQMALYILPRAAQLLSGLASPAANDLGQHMQARLQMVLPRLEKGVRAQWQAQRGYFTRAVLRDFFNRKCALHADQLDLEGQVWAFIGDRDLEPDMLDKLKKSVFKACDHPSKIGALMASGQVWPAVSQMLTWGYTRRYPDLAWRSFVNHTFAQKSQHYGNLWMNVWSGPDGINGPKVHPSGGTYETFPVTPMTDFPTMNNNQHAMALLALLRVCGIEPTASGDGLRITPKMPARYALKLPLLSLKVSPECIEGEYQYHAHNPSTRTLTIRLSSHPTSVQATVNGQSVSVQPDAEGYVRLSLPTTIDDDRITFEVRATNN